MALCLGQIQHRHKYPEASGEIRRTPHEVSRWETNPLPAIPGTSCRAFISRPVGTKSIQPQRPQRSQRIGKRNPLNRISSLRSLRPLRLIKFHIRTRCPSHPARIPSGIPFTLLLHRWSTPLRVSDHRLLAAIPPGSPGLRNTTTASPLNRRRIRENAEARIGAAPPATFAFAFAFPIRNPKSPIRNHSPHLTVTTSGR